ncbi:hypothetical protein SGPA1_51018 [Streptomyces misionensis JCM 4497]
MMPDRLGVKPRLPREGWPGNSTGPNPTAHLAGVGEGIVHAVFRQGQAPSSVQGRPRRHTRRCHRCRRRRPADGGRQRLRRHHLPVGHGRPVRVRRQLVHQHRQRLLRRSAVLRLHLGRVRRHRLRPHGRQGRQGAADSRRREGPGRAGQGRLAGLRHGPVEHPVQRLRAHFRLLLVAHGHLHPLHRRAGRHPLHPAHGPVHHGQVHGRLHRLLGARRGQDRHHPDRQEGQEGRRRVQGRHRRHPQLHRGEAPRGRRLAQAVRAEQGHRRQRRPHLPGPAAAPEVTPGG